MENKLNKFKEILSLKRLVLDGALGTMIQKRGLSENDFRGERYAQWDFSLSGFNDLLSITKPEILEDIYLLYLNAGADIITTNSFNSNSISMGEYGLQKFAYEFNFAAAKVARKVVDEFGGERFVAGSVGPTSHSLTIEPFLDLPEDKMVSYEMLVESYVDQIGGLVDGGVDIILVETAYDIINVEAAVAAYRKVADDRGVELPLMVSLTISEASGRTLSGHSPIDIYNSIKNEKSLVSMGLNCSFGAEQMLPHLKELAAGCDTFISSHPNAGMPDAYGNYSQTPEVMVESIKKFIESDVVNIVGGCCGTTPEHIALISQVISSYLKK